MTDNKKPEFLYHGSDNGNIEEFEARKATGFGGKNDDKEAVYATPSKTHATIFAIKNLLIKPKDSFRIWSIEYPDGLDREPKVVVQLGTINENGGIGYIYTLPADTFMKDHVHQYLSDISVRPKGQPEPVDGKDYRYWVIYEKDYKKWLIDNYGEEALKKYEDKCFEAEKDLSPMQRAALKKERAIESKISHQDRTNNKSAINENYGESLCNVNTLLNHINSRNIVAKQKETDNEKSF